MPFKNVGEGWGAEGGMAQLVKHLLHKNKDLSSYPQYPLNKESQAQPHFACNPNARVPRVRISEFQACRETSFNPSIWEVSQVENG